MMPSQSTNVFVSYSHADVSLVAPVVQLLRVNKSLVFQDFDGIQPGKRWRSEIAKALTDSHLVVVFWCDHARRSDEVSKEWNAAIEQEKDLLPVLLDSTPLPSALDEFQWIDFRGTVGANHGDANIDLADMGDLHDVPRWLSLGGLTAGLACAVALSLFILNAPQAPQSTPEPKLPGPIPLPPLPPAEAFDFVPSILILLGGVLVVTACLAWLSRRRSKHEAAIERPSPHPGAIERRMASEVEAEILRRTAMRRDGGNSPVARNP
ncbi:MAG: toll/interleukin-1 receptor domain-containing protein [Candidatus Binatia bacterium]